MPAPEEDIQQRLARLEAKQDELLADVKWLVQNQAAVDARLGRVEDSMVFRTLRAIGRFYQTRITRARAGASRGYAEWPGRAVMNARPIGHLHVRPLISVVLPVCEPARERLQRALDSLKAQTYTEWELAPAYAESAPGWARQLLGDARQPSGAWIAHLGENDFLSPRALEHFAAAVQDGSPDLVYSDAEIVDAQGRPLRPVFKPDWSPVLMRSAPYIDGLHMERAGLTGEPANVVHIARILYYAQEGCAVTPAAPKPLRATPLVSIIVCTRNSRLLARCLAGIRDRTEYPNTEVIVVQHLGSSPGAEEREVTATAERFGAAIVPFTQSFNFSEMNNLGARAAKGGVLLFLNDDVEPIEPGWLSRMLSHLEDPAVGAVGAKLLYPDGTIQHAGIVTWLIDGAGHPGRHLVASENWPWLPCTREVSAVTGACLCVRRADFHEMQGFDPVFPVNYNDVDFCLRLRAAGYSVIFEAGAVLRHDESQTRRPGTRYDERRLFFRRWWNITEKTDPYYNPHLAQNNEDLSLK